MKQRATVKAKILYILGALIGISTIQLLFSYSSGFRMFYIYDFYPVLSFGLRVITGWFPFSMGDLFYVLVGIWFLFGLIYFIKVLFKRKKYPWIWGKVLLHFIGVVLTIYFIFLLFWGMNYRYDRVGVNFNISQNFTIQERDLKDLCDTLAKKLNVLHLEVTGSDTMAVKKEVDFPEIRKQAFRSYTVRGYENRSLHYYPESVKPSMFGQLMNYSGVTGYYNPFTGEAQVNTTPPKVEIPFTTCHEMAHQIGFAAEEDANFIGYLVAAQSPYPLFQYSANFSLFMYAINRLTLKDREWADSLWNNELSLGVRKDYRNYFLFFQKYRTSFRKISNRAYDQYLKANQQQNGIKSYRGIVALIIDYQKKYGKLP